MKKTTSLTVEVMGSSASDLDGLTTSAIQDALVDLSSDSTATVGGGTDIVDDNGNVVGRITWGSQTSTSSDSDITVSTERGTAKSSKTRGAVARFLLGDR